MATGWTISIGYISGYSFEGNKEEAWQILKRITQAAANNPERIKAEVHRVEELGPSLGEDYDLIDVCQTYRLPPNEGCPLVVNEDERYVFLIASGQRTLKESAHRAFCRLVIDAMHRQGIEVNLTVA